MGSFPLAALSAVKPPSLTPSSPPLQDVCAGTIIALEAGGILFGSKDRGLEGKVDGELITGRKYLIMRGIPEGLEGQRKLAAEFFERVEEWDQL